MLDPKFSTLLIQVSILFGSFSGNALAVRKKIINRKVNIKNILNKWRKGNPEIIRTTNNALKIRKADEKLAGRIKNIYANIGSQRGSKVWENLVSDNFTFERYLAVYVIIIIAANEEVWKPIPIIGISIHLLAAEPPIIVPWDNVYANNANPIGRRIIDIPLNSLNGTNFTDNINIIPKRSTIRCFTK